MSYARAGIAALEDASFDVELSHVAKSFDGLEVLKDLSLSIASGQFVTLLGPSGCGKTTTLRLIGGFEEPDEGRVTVRGQRVGGPRNDLTRMVFQSYALFPHLTVSENVAFGLEMQGVKRGSAAGRIRDVLDTVGILDKATEYPHKLSGGQQQRVALARALVTEPRVLLLDEPLGALDLQMRKRMQVELKRLQRQLGITFVYVTHDQSEALAMSDLVVVMDDGRIVQADTPEAVYDAPATKFVAEFVGDTNLVNGRVVSISGDTVWLETEIGLLGGSGGAYLPRVGDLSALVLRPEKASLEPIDGAVAIPCRVVERVFLGNSARLIVEASGGVSLVVDAPGSTPLHVDSVVEVWWCSREARVVA